MNEIRQMQIRKAELDRAETLAADLRDVMERAKDVLSEARGFVQDIINLNIYTRELINREVDTQVKDRLKTWNEDFEDAVQKRLDKALEQAGEEFDKVIAIMMGRDKQSQRAGKLPVEKLVEKEKRNFVADAVAEATRRRPV